MKKLAWVFGGFILAACFILWGVAEMDYGDGAAVGPYRFERAKESSTLILNSDHTFQQTRSIGSDEQHSAGTWRHVGEGGISFSKEFLMVSGDEPEPDGTTFSELHKAFGLFSSLRLRQYHVLWYGKVDSGKSLAGTYKGDQPGVTATLVLNADHSFSQTIALAATTNHATGTWSQDSGGTVRFSNAFLKTSGEPLQPDELASSIDPQGSNLQIEISKAANITEPVFRKTLFKR